jgi:hypothetical protein
MVGLGSINIFSVQLLVHKPIFLVEHNPVYEAEAILFFIWNDNILLMKPKAVIATIIKEVS